MSDKHWLDGAPRTRAKIQGRIFYANVGDLEREMLEFTADLERETAALTAELAAMKAELDAAQAELMAIYAHNCESDGCIHPEDCSKQALEWSGRWHQMKEERDAALKDAERYQFLRNENTWCDDDPQGGSGSLWVRLGEATASEFDAIVDAAIDAAREG